jgi:hypothetical protein
VEPVVDVVQAGEKEGMQNASAQPAEAAGHWTGPGQRKGEMPLQPKASNGRSQIFKVARAQSYLLDHRLVKLRPRTPAESLVTKFPGISSLHQGSFVSFFKSIA